MACRIIMFYRYYVPHLFLRHQNIQILNPKLSFHLSKASSYHYYPTVTQTNFPIKPKLSSFITDSEIQTEFSHHDPGVARINNGSFGCSPASVTSALQQWQLNWLRQPDRFYFNELHKGILKSRNTVKDLINAEDVDEISIVDNATTAVAIVLHQMQWAFSEGRFKKGDAVITLQYAYGAVKNSIKAYFERAGGEEGVDQVFIDGAHGVGCVDVDMQEIGADFYTSNLHKWFFCPASVAFLYCRKSVTHSELHHPMVSHDYGKGLAIESCWIGTRDYSPSLVVPSAVEFTNRFEGGIDGIKRRNHDAVVEMGQMLAKAWGTNLGSPPDMCPSMIMVGMPACLGVSSDDDALKLRTHLREKFGVEVPIYYRMPKHEEVATATTAYARVSHQVYNKVDDYYKFRDAINQLVCDGFTCARSL
uniref:putative L-cysteine desulfhydrase 1 isoform X2 n=1 Tax=Fragaria vesca subsp. vesca TaxID=101020 RepID=UPI0005CA50F5|nr:PREDICTED: putative L-cysteine desulfhydrase 1 isoform X2 [Fragaria vesca subsp. vesca]